MLTIPAVRLFRTADDYLTLNYAQAAPRYGPQGERLRDRLGLVHRIAPSAPRCPVALSLTLIPEELVQLNNEAAPERQSALEWLEQAFREQEPLTLFVLTETLAAEGAALSRLLAYQGYLDELPPEWGALPLALSMPESIELSFVIIADGTFTDFDDVDSAEYEPR
jgi:hypothetical protein